MYAVCDPELKWARIASAGHWPPVLAAPEGAAALLDITPGILIGVDDQPQRQSMRVPIPRGAVLCFYTDGLIERPDVLIDASLARLCESIVPGTRSAPR
jgi:sigma-B regulation protein RsbU (phosphoserine phosphatase)